MITFENVTKQYADKIAVDDVSFDINEGEIFVLIGPSGCGKTTTLKMINRLIPLSDGTIYFNDKKISTYPLYEMRWDIGYVLQQIALFPHMTIQENIATVPLMKKWKEADIQSRTDELLNMVGLEPETYKKRYPRELSGGQQQRIGVVRALAADPPVILMDEPFSALDPISRTKLQEDLLQLQSAIKKTIVFVTHDIREALTLGDRICLMNNGKVEQLGTPEDFIYRPANEFVREFLGELDGYLIREVKLADMMREFPVLERAENVDYPEVSGDLYLSDVYEDLANQSPILVRTDEGIKVLKRKDVFKLLSESKRGGNS